MTTVTRIAQDIADDIRWKIQDGLDAVIEELVQDALIEIQDEAYVECDNIVNGLSLRLPPLDPEFMRGVMVGIAMMQDATRGELKEFWTYESA